MHEGVLGAAGLVKRFGELVAVDGIDFTVTPGEAFGFLGPNGAGKSTTLRILSGLVRADGGKAAIFGAIAFGLANASVGKLLAVLTLPITFLTLGLFLLVINALMLMLAAAFVEGFEVEDFGSALWGAVALSVMNFLVGMMF